MPVGTWTNCRGTSKRQKRCSVCGPWKTHWEQKSKKKIPKKCQIKYHDGNKWVPCKKDATLGAHVRNKSTKKPNNQYIIPACGGCNKRGGKKTDAKFQLQTIIVSAIQCRIKALRVGKKTTNKMARKKSFNPPGRNSKPPDGFMLKDGYKCTKKVGGRRTYWTRTGIKSDQKNACKNQPKKIQKKKRKSTKYCNNPKSKGSKRCWMHKGKQGKDRSKCGYPLQ